jgi:hypothetical protein
MKIGEVISAGDLVVSYRGRIGAWSSSDGAICLSKTDLNDVLLALETFNISSRVD